MSDTFLNIITGANAIIIGLLAFDEQISKFKNFKFFKFLRFKISIFILASFLNIWAAIKKDSKAKIDNDWTSQKQFKKIDSLQSVVTQKNLVIDSLNTKIDTLIQLARNKDYQIELLKSKTKQLVDKANTISTIEARVEIFVPLVAKPDDAEINEGIDCILAFFDRKKQRIRFITDDTWIEQQINPTTQRMYFIYKPETPEQIIGKPIEYINDLEVTVVSFSGLWEMTKKPIDEKKSIITFTVLVNNKVIISNKIYNHE